MDACQSGCGLAAAFSYAAAPAVEWVTASSAILAERIPWFLPLAAGVAGSAFASLAGLVVDRLPRIRGWRGEPEPGLGLASPASHCESCGAHVPARALVPVLGWFLASGRCGECSAPVPRLYPAMEASVGAVTLAIVALAGPSQAALSTVLLFWLMTFCAWIDVAEHEIPDCATVPLLFAGILLSPFEPDMQARVLGAALAGLAVMGAFRITGSALRKGDAMSLGDVALAGALGAWGGLCAVPAMLVLGCLSYVAYALPLRRRGVVWVPMGPGLCAGLVAALALGARFS